MTKVPFEQLASAVLGNESGGSMRAGIWGDGGGAAGPMQVHPAALADVNAKLGTNYTHAQLAAEPAIGKLVGTTYLRMLYDRHGGEAEPTLASYNAGPGAVDRALASGQPLPARAYVQAALQRIGGPTANDASAPEGFELGKNLLGAGATPTSSWKPPPYTGSVPDGGQDLMKNTLLASTLSAGFAKPVQLIQVDYNPFAAVGKGASPPDAPLDVGPSPLGSLAFQPTSPRRFS